MPKKVFTGQQAKEVGDKLGIKWDKWDVEQFRMGMDVELEHGKVDLHTNVTNDDPIVTGKIALAHLNEFPDYYTRLEKMEAKKKTIAICDKLGLSFDGMQGNSYQFTVVRGPEKAKGITFYVTDLAKVESRLREKFKEFGVSGILGAIFPEPKGE